MTQMTQATQQKIVSNMHIALPCDAVELVSELVRKLGGEIITQDEAEYTAAPLREDERMGRMLKGLRLRAEMTQKELARAIQVPQSHISQYEANTRPIPKAKAQELAKLLNTVESHFLSR